MTCSCRWLLYSWDYVKGLHGIRRDCIPPHTISYIFYDTYGRFLCFSEHLHAELITEHQPPTFSAILNQSSRPCRRIPAGNNFNSCKIEIQVWTWWLDKQIPLPPGSTIRTYTQVKETAGSTSPTLLSRGSVGAECHCNAVFGIWHQENLAFRCKAHHNLAKCTWARSLRTMHSYHQINPRMLTAIERLTYMYIVVSTVLLMISRFKDKVPKTLQTAFTVAFFWT
jgi:hypothetical protein